MSSISNVEAICSTNSITISADFYISDQSDYRVDMTIYTMGGEVIKTGYSSWSDWSGAPGTRNFQLTPDYPLAIATQYYYVVQLSRRDSGTVLDRETGYAATKLAHFEWDTPKRQGEDVNITASEWNRLWDKCVAEVAYVGNGTLIPIYVNTGDIITAEAYDNLVNVFAYDLGYNRDIELVYRNQIMTAQSINDLRDAINYTIDHWEYNSQPIPVEPIDPRGDN